MAKNGAEDGRPMVVFTLADFDPAGVQMSVSVGRKLQAFKTLYFPDLEFEIVPVALTEEQVRELDLPSTPLKKTERRANGWREKHNGLEQTELDAVATLQPRMLTKIVEEAIAPYFDATLSRRVSEAKWAWVEEAQARVDEQVDHEMLSMLRNEARAKLDTLREEIDAINDALRTTTDSIRLGLPHPIVPEPILTGEELRKPLLSSRWSWAEQTKALIERKRYGGGPDEEEGP